MGTDVKTNNDDSNSDVDIHSRNPDRRQSRQRRSESRSAVRSDRPRLGSTSSARRLKLRHYDTTEITELDRSRVYEQASGPKPAGMWVSDERNGDDGWKRWCRVEEFYLSGLAYEHEVKLTGRENILYLRTVQDIDDFTIAYRAKSPQNDLIDEFRDNYFERMYGEMYGGIVQERHRRLYTMDIDWPRVAEHYQGIIITPYQWGRRLSSHTTWYYGWDCASGVIWDMSAIGRIELKRFRKKYAAVVELTWEERMAELRRVTDNLAEETKDTDHPFPTSEQIEAEANKAAAR